MNVLGLVCIVCGREYAEPEAPAPGERASPIYTCASCGVEGILDVVYDYDRVSWPPRHRLAGDAFYGRTLWRYLDLLPVRADRELPSLQVGLTPVAEFPRLAEWAGVGHLRLKDDGRQPSASFKDRASAIGVVRAIEGGYGIVAAASTGNAAVSLACMASNRGIVPVIFVPAKAPEAKVAQLRAFGARVMLVDGPYEKAYDLCQRAVEAFGWYNRNCAVNPYLVEGKKTCGLEIGEQCAADPPDWVAVSVGDGCTIAGVWKGLCEMHKLGVLPRLPRLLGVQASGAQPLTVAFERGEELLEVVDARTCADSICVGEPRNWRKGLRAVKASQGAYISVDDEAILEAAAAIPARTGIFAEPTAAASMAGVKEARARGLISASDRVLMVVTGNGLKDVRGATAKAPAATNVSGALDELRAACGDLIA